MKRGAVGEPTQYQAARPSGISRVVFDAFTAETGRFDLVEEEAVVFGFREGVRRKPYQTGAKRFEPLGTSR